MGRATKTEAAEHLARAEVAFRRAQKALEKRSDDVARARYRRARAELDAADEQVVQLLRAQNEES